VFGEENSTKKTVRKKLQLDIIIPSIKRESKTLRLAEQPHQRMGREGEKGFRCSWKTPVFQKVKTGP